MMRISTRWLVVLLLAALCFGFGAEVAMAADAPDPATVTAAEPAEKSSSKTVELWRSTGLHGFFSSGGLTRIMTFDKVKTLGGRLVPTVMVLVPEDKPEEKTVITYESLELGLGLEPEFFSRSTLTRKDLVR